MGWFRPVEPTRFDQRRTGPPGEARWWVDADQAFAEQRLLTTADLGRGWQSVPMPNNTERLDPHGDDEHSAIIRAAREDRTLTALDEGAAWRHRKDRVLVVPRVEVFVSTDDRAHRGAWKEHGAACLDAVWRERWREREVVPGWIEARWKDDSMQEAGGADGGAHDAWMQIDWISVEDHTSTRESGVVDRYEHLTIWCGRVLATVTVRHDDSLDLDLVTAAVGLSTYRRIWHLDR